MGKQVNFWLLPDDLADIQRAIEDAGPVQFLADRTRTEALRDLHTLVIPPGEMGNEPLRVYAVRLQDRPSVKVKWYERPQVWSIDSSDSPVLEIDRCYYNGLRISQGRVYFATDLRFRPRLPDPDFVRWGTSVLRRIRRKLILDKSIDDFAYITRNVQEWYRASGARRHGLDLRVDAPVLNDPYATVATRGGGR